MALLAEYALIPDIFDSTRYQSPDMCGVYLQSLKEVMLSEGLVRNLRNGDWQILFTDGSSRAWHQRGKELLKKLIVQKRMPFHPPVLPDAPTNDSDWCKEAIASHDQKPLLGVITTTDIASTFSAQPVVAAIDKLPNTPWWINRSPSIRLNRILADYEQHLSLVLSHANSIMFIDPHLDLRKKRYFALAKIINRLVLRTSKPLVEIHRVSWEKIQGEKRYPTTADWEQRFRTGLSSIIGSGLKVIVYIWDDFHDRYLISNLIGISVPNGFDTTETNNLPTTWNRLGRNERDDIQREFDLAANRHMLRASFTIS